MSQDERLSQDERHLRQIDREWNEAYPNRNIEALNRIIADAWKCIDGTGRVVSKQQLLERVSANPNPFASHEFDEFDMRIFGDTAIITGAYLAKVEMIPEISALSSDIPGCTFGERVYGGP